MKIAVIDGLGGGLGGQIIEHLKKELGNRVEITALGTNSAATSRMINNGADQGATGENSIRVTTKKVDIITGPLGIIIPDSMFGEITNVMAEAILNSPARVFLIGNKQPHVELIGLKEQSISQLVDELALRIKGYIANC